MFWAAREKKMETRSDMQICVLASPRKTNGHTLRHAACCFEQPVKKRWKHAQPCRLMFWAAREKKMETGSDIRLMFWAARGKNMETRSDMQTDVLGRPRSKDGNTFRYEKL